MESDKIQNSPGWSSHVTNLDMICRVCGPVPGVLDEVKQAITCPQCDRILQRYQEDVTLVLATDYLR